MVLRVYPCRLKHSIVTALILACLGVYFLCLPNTALEYPIQLFKLNQKRSEFKNPIYSGWPTTTYTASSLDSNCDQYLKRLSSYLPRRKSPSFDKVVSTKFPLLLYQKKKWVAEEKKHYRRRLKSQGIQISDLHVLELEQIYYRRLQELSSFEEGFVEDINHLRVLGKCLLSSHCSSLSSGVFSYELVAQLLPWLLGNMPSVDRKLAAPLSREKHILAQVIESLKGRGIVVPMLPGQERSVQIRNTKSLIHILRAIGNKLPIEIVYVGEKFINEESTASILAAGKKKADLATHSRDEYLKENEMDDSLLEFPPQLISFINLEPSIAKSVAINDNFILALSAIFNSFDEMMLISPKTIPLKKDLEGLFENHMYKEHGTLFFKQKSLISFKPQKAPAGAFDAKDLINNYAGVNNFDKQLFGLEEPQITETNVIRHKGYTTLIDLSLMIINKTKALAGLLISSALPFYGALSATYDFSEKFNPELMWLGQELSGSVRRVNFNPNDAVAAGVLTPAENVPPESPSQELCSSSWAQLYDDGHTLVYVTSHQLDNRVLESFTHEVKKKYAVRGNEKDQKDEYTAHPKIERNILAIESVLLPAKFEEVQFNLHGQQSASWRQLDSFGLVNDYWCAYDVVGGSDQQNRGIIIDYGKRAISLYQYLLDIWWESGQA